MFILVRIFLLILRYLFYYLRSFYPHISDIVCLYFRTHLNMILHTYLSIYYVFVFVSHTCMYMLYFFLYISLYSHTSHIFLYSHLIHFVKTFFCNTCIAYVYVSHTFGFDFLFSKADASHTFVLYFLKILEYK